MSETIKKDSFVNIMLKYILIILMIILLCDFIQKKAKPYKNKKKGRIGEKAICKILKKLPVKEYLVLNDVLLKTKNGTVQIDHIVLSEYGIFVIETKNYSGLIFGNGFAPKWKQRIGKSYLGEIDNPILQNKAHIYALMNTLDINTSDIFLPISTFSHNCILKVNAGTPVVYYDELIRIIKSYRNQKLSKEQVIAYTKILQLSNINSRKNLQKHIKYVQSVRYSAR